jgi:hypothetical protein
MTRETLISLFGAEDEGWNKYKTRNGITMVKSGKRININTNDR